MGEQKRSMREHKGAETKHINEMNFSGGAKQWYLNQSAVMCCPKYGGIYIYIYIYTSIPRPDSTRQHI